MSWKGFILFFVVGIIFTSCSTPRRVAHTSNYKYENSYKASRIANHVVENAYHYIGTPYQYGGTTSSGMDCSGLVINAYGESGIQMPRVSRDQANVGKKIQLRNVRRGDLIFFSTSGRGINHVGIVDKVENGEIFFVHSSSSKGVIVSSMNLPYWKDRFVKATRVL